MKNDTLSRQPNWRLICPKKNWQNPIEITERDLGLLVAELRALCAETEHQT